MPPSLDKMAEDPGDDGLITAFGELFGDGAVRIPPGNDLAW